MFLLYTVSRVIEPRMASVGRVEMRLQYIRNIFSENPELSKTGGRQVLWRLYCPKVHRATYGQRSRSEE